MQISRVQRPCLPVGILGILVWLSPAVAGDEPQQAYGGAHFKRVTLVVSDLERSPSIYRDILGFELDGISESGPDSYSYPVFRIPKGAKIRTASLLRSADLERDFRRLEALGLETTEPKFVDGKELDFWERAFVDFDGHLIVLYQIVPPPEVRRDGK